jgi:hypothetical protein
VARESRGRKYFGNDHGRIISAVNRLLEVADGDAGLAQFAACLSRHEKRENELDLPARGLSGLVNLGL